MTISKYLWREKPTGSLDVNELKTVTYGLTSSYLVIRSLQESATKLFFCSTDFYVDDLITGGYDPDKVAKLANQIIKVLRSGGFELRKLVSYDPPVIL